MKNLLVTGATGFVGRHLIPKLTGNYNVFCLVRKNSKGVMQKGAAIAGDLLSYEDMVSATKNMDIVVHLGAAVQSIDADENYRVNAEGTKMLVEACIHNRVKKFIYVSSVNASFKNRGAYGESKRIGEFIVKTSEVPFVILRPTMIYGKGDVGLPQTLIMLKSLPFVPIVGNARAATQPVYVEDVVSAISAAAESKKAEGKTYLIAGPKSFTLNEYFETVSRIAGLGRKIFVKLPVFPFRALVGISEFLGKKMFMTREQLLSMTEEKETDISEAMRDLKFKPVDFEKKFGELIQKQNYP